MYSCYFFMSCLSQASRMIQYMRYLLRLTCCCSKYLCRTANQSPYVWISTFVTSFGACYYKENILTVCAKSVTYYYPYLY